MLSEKIEQITFKDYLENNQYEIEVEFIEKQLKTDLLKGKLKYKLNKNELKEWFCNKMFNVNFLENITCQDLYFIAEEKCNIILIY